MLPDHWIARAISRWGSTAVLFAALFVLAVRTASGATSYTVIDLGTLGGNGSFAYGINNLGQVVGIAQTAGNAGTVEHPFLWTRGHMIDLQDDMPSPFVAGGPTLAINSAGDVVGSMGAGGLTNTNAHGFLWSNGVVTDLGPGTAVGINASGQVLLDDYALGGINDAGHVATGDFLYLSWPAGTATNLGNLGSPDPAATNAYALNNSDVITGASFVNSIPHAFRWDTGVVADLSPPNTESVGNAINSAGVIVGNFNATPPDVPKGPQRAMIVDETGMHDLNDAIAAGSGWRLDEAQGINDFGEIVGEALTPAGLYDHAFLLEACGNGVLMTLAGEECDDGNTVDGDGCDATCHLEPLSVSGTGTVATGTGTSAGAPAQAAVTSPSGGAITIMRSADVPGTPGVAVLGTFFHITAPTESPTSPLELVFDIDPSVIPPDEDVNTIEVLKNGVAIPPCTGPAGEASPDPCVESRTALPGGGGEFLVLSSDASDWTFGVPLCTPMPRSGCKKPTAAAKSSLSLKTKGSVLTWKWGSGAATAKSEFGRPTTSADYALCVYDESAGTPSLKTTVGVAHGGTCSGKPCWKESKSGFSYASKSATGTLKAKLTAGVVGKAKLQLTGKGSAIQFPALPLQQDPSAVVQIVNGNGACWEATYSSHAASDGATFKAKSD